LELRLGRITDLKLLFLSFYPLDYGIGASASLIDQLMDLPSHTLAIVIEPIRIDLPRVEVKLPNTVHVEKIHLPLKGGLSFIYPFLAFFKGLKIASTLKPNIIFSMHHSFHTLSLTGHIISKILHISHVVDVHDVWRSMGLKKTKSSYLKDFLERIIVKIICHDLMIFVCSEHKKILESRAMITFENALILPNCVSYHLIESIKKEKHIIGKTIRFIFVGRTGSEYALNKIYPLLNKLCSYGYKPTLLIVGHRQINTVSKYAKYIGSLSRKKTLQLIAESDVGVGPMNPTITIPKKVVEYLVLGKIVIVGRNAVSKDILNEWDNIIEVSETDDMNHIICRMMKMLKHVNSDNEKIEKLYCRQKIKIIIGRLLPDQA